MRILLTAVLAALAALASTAAHAQLFERDTHYFLPAGKTFAVRALCPPAGGIYLLVLPWEAPLASTSNYCVNGRQGLSFTVPPGAPIQDITIHWTWNFPQPFSAFKAHIDPDCADNATTTCVLTPNATAAGRFTYGGDADWFRLEESDVELFDIRTTTPRNTCVVVGQVVTRPDDINYLVLSGGPAGCTYTVTARERDPAN